MFARLPGSHQHGDSWTKNRAELVRSKEQNVRFAAHGSNLIPSTMFLVGCSEISRRTSEMSSEIKRLAGVSYWSCTQGWL